MGKHAAATEDEMVPVSNGLGLPGRLAVGAAALVTVIGAGVLIGPGQAFAKLPWAGQQSCQRETVELVVAPEITSLVQQILKPVAGSQTSSNTCVAVDVRGQEPQETVTSADVLPLDRAPQLWIPDSSVWGEKASQQWVTRSAGSLAKTFVVLATSKKATEALGWSKRNPTWLRAMRGIRPVAVPDYRAQSESLDALIALWQTLGKGKYAANEVVGTVYAADRGELPTPTQAIADARSGSANAPLLPATEQAVAAINAAATTKNVVAVYPREGSPVLDYPILQLTGSTPTASRAAAVAAVLKRLKSPAAVQQVRQAGFRGPNGERPQGVGIVPSNSKVLTSPSTAEVDGMLRRMENLSKPSRILALMDVSLSMQARLDDGITRIQLGAGAARLGANLLPDRASVGVWLFAANMGGGKDYRVLNPVKRLGSRTPGGESQRSTLINATYNPGRYLTGGGTALYDTTLAAVKDMHAHYDPKADNAIILLSDGANEDSNSVSLSALLATIAKLNKGSEKVAVYTAAIGPQADFSSLKQIATASGGFAYRINTALQGQRALLDGLRRSRNIGTR